MQHRPGGGLVYDFPGRIFHGVYIILRVLLIGGQAHAPQGQLGEPVQLLHLLPGEDGDGRGIHGDEVHGSAAALDNPGNLVLGELHRVGGFYAVGEEHQIAQPGFLPGNGGENGVNGFIQVGAVDRIGAGRLDGIGPGARVGELFPEDNPPAHGNQHHGILGPQGLAQGQQTGTLLLPLDVAQGAGDADHAVVGNPQIGFRQGGGEHVNFPAIGGGLDGAAGHGDAQAVYVIPPDAYAGVEQLLPLGSGAQGQSPQQHQAKQQCSASFHFIAPLSCVGCGYTPCGAAEALGLPPGRF